MINTTRLASIAMGAFAAALIGVGAAQAARPQLFVLAGQSNMVGASLSGPIDGPGIYFARDLARLKGSPIATIQCAVGGSPLAAWAGTDPAYGDLWAACLAKIAGRHVDGLLMFQGETDAAQEYTALSWGERFGGFVARARSDLGPIPVVYGQISDLTDAGLPYSETVQASQASVVLADTSMIVSSDLPRIGQHFTAVGYAEVGRRFANAWYGTTSPWAWYSLRWNSY